jgi:hypothetical protein
MSQPQEEKLCDVINIDDYIYDEDFKEGKLAIFPVVISSDEEEEETDRDESPCPSPPIISDSDDDEDYVPGTPQAVPETPVELWPIAEDNVPPPSPEFGGSSPEL